MAEKQAGRRSTDGADPDDGAEARLGTTGTSAATPEGTETSRKRRAPRVAVRRRVEGEVEDARVFGFTKDIGWGGMFIRTADVLPEGSEVDLRVQLQADAPPVTVHGRVVRAQADGTDRGMAIAFHARGAEPERQFIASFVREMELQIKLEQLEEAKRKFLAEVRAFQEEKVALERQRLAFADRELAQSKEAAGLREQMRRLKRDHLDKVQHAEEQRRRAEVELAAERRAVKAEREQMRRDRAELGDARALLEDERARAHAETEELKRTLDAERDSLLDDLDRERKLHKALAERKASSREKEFERRLEKMRQRIGSLEHVNEILEARARDFENRAASIRGEEAARAAAFAARLEELEAGEAEHAARGRAHQARLEARIEQLQSQLQAARRDADNDRRSSAKQMEGTEAEIGELRDQNQRLNQELDDLDAARAQLIADLRVSQDRRAELETDLRELQLELDETRTRLELRDSMFDELELSSQVVPVEVDAAPRRDGDDGSADGQ